MNITQIGFAFIFIIALLGFSRGVLKIFAAVIAFLVSSVIAKLLSPYIGGLVALTGLVPKTLATLTSWIFLGLIIFVVIYFFASRLLTSLEESREEYSLPRLALWERIGGGLIGAAWGCFLVIFTLTGIHMVGSVKDTLTGTSEPPAAEATADTVSQPATTSSKKPLFPSDLDEIQKQIDGSPFSPLVKKVDPVDEEAKETLVNIKKVLEDPELYQKFKNHPAIVRLMEDEKILALSEDEAIRQQLRDKEFYQLLDNEKIAALLNERKIYRKLKKIEFGEILKEISTEEK